MQNVFIIIVTYNGMRWLPKCLSSINSINVVIVDNNSSDNSVEFINKNFPQYMILKQNKNLGFGAANNIGISYAMKKGAEYVFLLNQDAYVNKDTLTALIKAHKSNLNFGILSPLHYNGNRDYLDRNFSNFMAYLNNRKFYFDAINKDFKNVYEVPFINAAAWLIPRSTLSIVGGFDPIFFHYGEDNNYCQRTLYHNLKIGVVPQSEILHDRSSDIKKFESFTESYFADKEKNYKILLGDVNRNNKKLFLLHRNDLIKKLLISVFTLNTKFIRGNISELKMLRRCLLESNRSKINILNSKKKYLYLNV